MLGEEDANVKSERTRCLSGGKIDSWGEKGEGKGKGNGKGNGKVSVRTKQHTGESQVGRQECG